MSNDKKLTMENTTNQSDEKGHDANIVLAVSGQTLKELIFAIGYTLDAIDVRATDPKRFEAKEKAAKILESLMAACASGAVDKTVSDGCFCGSKDFVTRHMIRQCADCGRPV